MGEAVGERDGLMNPGLSKAAEAIIAVLLPPACREEVLGDLYERYRSPLQYSLDALRTIPLVVLSRIRRTADPQVLLLQAFALYASFLGAAWMKGGGGPLRLAVPAGIALLGMMLEEAYSKPGSRSLLRLVRGPVVGLGLALLSQALFRAVPRWTMLYGCAMSLLLCSAIRMLFPPVERNSIIETRFVKLNAKIAIFTTVVIWLVALWWMTTGMPARFGRVNLFSVPAANTSWAGHQRDRDGQQVRCDAGDFSSKGRQDGTNGSTGGLPRRSGGNARQVGEHRHPGSLVFPQRGSLSPAIRRMDTGGDFLDTSWGRQLHDGKAGCLSRLRFAAVTAQ